MTPNRQPPSQKGWSALEQLPQGVLERIAEFCGSITAFSSTEQADQFTENIIDLAASNTREPSYQDLRSLALTSASLAYPAKRALLILYPQNRHYVRYFVARIADRIHSLPNRFIPPRPLVMASFIRNLYPVLSALMDGALPEHSFLRQTLISAIDTLTGSEPSEWGNLMIQIVGETGVNFHTIENQVFTTAVQLCPRVAATRFCFGEPRRHSAGPQPADQAASNTLLYFTLLQNCSSHLKSLTFDFGALYSLINFKSYVPGYPTGCLSSIKRLTLVGNRVQSELPYDLFTIEVFFAWLRTNTKLRELRLIDDFDKMIQYSDSRATAEANGNSAPAKPLNWNNILRMYKCTLEVLEMSWYRPSAFGMKARFGASGKLDCLSEMGKLRYLKVPLVALGGSDFIVLLGNDGKLIDMVHSELPARLKRVDLMVVNPPATRAERTDLKWRVVKCQI
ncbi:hypothetical protein NEUTE1DRAFT_36302 [Neurospora tetrasperma FGSC 2508]|uniref:Uncharacterized protein n=1 Tax=Neurospora tetrasperma (strain FGSC 2508 / ATCC MYA-4615 / P0657) TaxID=510951 RepID=F8MAL7_NEUT8|nr:uncharacterized protein NEUTE1DRAFT_36302 [Neurospora tetrasperma FGSC 2508]EGO60138.1 hypothetical protein NEUTE1DRAFT_36302 [Neurospora tetrasperma FGSC 2508]EGZ75910.1 hypothetical protein NEUTE2DRAFT_58239 [Neurospora tetrasperma FGSC 2509]